MGPVRIPERGVLRRSMVVGYVPEYVRVPGRGELRRSRQRILQLADAPGLGSYLPYALGAAVVVGVLFLLRKK